MFASFHSATCLPRLVIFMRHSRHQLRLQFHGSEVKPTYQYHHQVSEYVFYFFVAMFLEVLYSQDVNLPVVFFIFISVTSTTTKRRLSAERLPKGLLTSSLSWCVKSV